MIHEKMMKLALQLARSVEVHALQMAGNKVVDANMYVTLDQVHIQAKLRLARSESYRAAFEVFALRRTTRILLSMAKISNFLRKPESRSSPAYYRKRQHI